MTNTKMSFEQQAYELDGLWKPQSIMPADNERVKILSHHIPKDVKSILDVGCGGGIFINHLISTDNHFKRLCGVDRSEAALQYVNSEKKLASIDNLPFKDNEFDLVSSLEVLEHLPPQIYQLGLRELCRIAQKYILISVPNNDYLEAQLVSCPLCHTRYNPDYHMRSFDYASMPRLLDSYNFQCSEVFYIGKRPSYLGLDTIRAILNFSNTENLPWYAICPMCGYNKSKFSDKAFTEASLPVLSTGSIKRIIKNLWPRRSKPHWIAALYQRN